MIIRSLVLMAIASTAFAADLSMCDAALKLVDVGSGASTIIEHMPEGKVLLEITIDERGAVVDPKVIESTDHRLSKLALEAAVKMRFAPPKAKCRRQVPMTFKVQ